MALWSWFTGLFNKDGTLATDAYIGEISAEMFYKELAIQSCVNLIANTVARSEFLTFEKGKEIRGENYYLFNVEPNQNKSSSKFWRDVIHNLVYDNECLVIQNNDKLYVADSFTVDKYAFIENKYRDVIIDDYKLNNIYNESEVLHFELHNQKIRTVIEGLYGSYAKLIQASTSNFKKNSSKRATLEVPTNFTQTDKGQKDLADLLNNRFKKFFDADGNAVIPITNGMKYTELNSKIGENSGIGGRDIRAFIDDIFDFVAIGLQVPPSLLKGNVADTSKVVNDLLTFSVKPIAELITDEINRKMYGKGNYLERTYVKLDSSRVKAVDIKDAANALDVLTRIGAYCVDDCLRTLGMEPLDTEWSKSRWMTKNYSPIELMAKGGDTSGKN